MSFLRFMLLERKRLIFAEMLQFGARKVPSHGNVIRMKKSQSHAHDACTLTVDLLGFRQKFLILHESGYAIALYRFMRYLV